MNQAAISPEEFGQTACLGSTLDTVTMNPFDNFRRSQILIQGFVCLACESFSRNVALLEPQMFLRICSRSGVPLLPGTWSPIKPKLAGQPFPEALLKSISLRIDGGQYEASVAGKPDKGTYTLDLASMPKGMSITGTEGPNKGKTFPCIYEIEGDTLRVCYDLSGEKRPAEFKTAADTKLYLVTYSRVRE